MPDLTTTRIPVNDSSSSALSTGGNQLDVASISALKTISVSGLTNGRQAIASGYYTAGDGGGGIFVYDSSASGAEIPGILVSSNAGKGRWKRVMSGAYVDVRWTGAKINSDITGTTGADDTAAIQRAIDAGAYGLGGVKPGTPAFIPGGYARITGTLFIGYPEPAGSRYSYVTGGLVGIGSANVAGYGSVIVTNFSVLDIPAIAVESGRQSIVKGLSIIGQATRAVDTIGPGQGALRDIFWNRSNWENPAVTKQSSSNRRYSPYGGIVQNAYSGAAGETSPAPYPAVTVPAYMAQYLNNQTSIQYGRYVSAGLVLSDVKIQSFDVGILFNAFSANNGDQNQLDLVRVWGCTYGISTTQPNQRRLAIRNSSVCFCWIGACDNIHGLQYSGFDQVTNSQFDYNAFGFSSSSTVLTVDGLRSEGGGSLGTFKSLTLRQCSFQQGTYNNYTYPVIMATGDVRVDGLNLSASTKSDRYNYYLTTFPIPFVIASRTLSVANAFFYGHAIDEFPRPAQPEAFFADIESYSVSTTAQENQIVEAATRTLWPGLVWVKWNQSANTQNKVIWGSGLGEAERNRYWDGTSASVGANMSSAALSQRCPVPVGLRDITSINSKEWVHLDDSDTHYTDLKCTDFTLFETDQTVTVEGASCQYRQLYAKVVFARNGDVYPLRKGMLYHFVTGTPKRPVLMVCVKNPKDTGIADTSVFKIIYGYDGRAEQVSGLTWPKSGTLNSIGAYETRATRVINAYGPIIATFTSGSAAVTIDTSYGVDATKFFSVGDLITAEDPRILANGGHGQLIKPHFRVQSITNSATILMDNKAVISGTSRIQIE